MGGMRKEGKREQKECEEGRLTGWEGYEGKV